MNALPLRRIAALGIILALASASAFFVSVGPARAADTISSSEYLDTDTDGTVDRIRWLLDENVTSCDYEAGDWTVNTASELNISITGLSCTGDNTALDILVDADADETSAATDPVISYANQGTAGSVTLASGAMTAKSNVVTDTDNAAPVVLTESPADSAGNVSTGTNIVLTFSEAMVTTFAEGTEFSLSPDPGSFTVSFSENDTQVTIDPDTDLAAGTSHTFTTDNTQIDAASGGTTQLVTTGPEDGDVTFTTLDQGGGSQTPPSSESKTYGVTVLSPDGGETLVHGSKAEISWETSGTGDIPFVDISYRADASSSYTLITQNEANDGSYSWLVPDITTDEALIRVVGTDLAVQLASDVSDGTFTLAPTSEGVPEPTDETEPEPLMLPDTATSPFSGEEEQVSEVRPGDYITGASYDTVYYIDQDGMRHPFLTRQDYFTWEDSFATVRTVTNATLPLLQLADTPMLPKPGVILVKIQSDPSTYALEATDDPFRPALRLISTELTAVSLYGESWADYVIDVPPTFFQYFHVGEDVTSSSDIEVDLDIMKTREALNE